MARASQLKPKMSREASLLKIIRCNFAVEKSGNCELTALYESKFNMKIKVGNFRKNKFELVKYGRLQIWREGKRGKRRREMFLFLLI